MTRLTKRNTDCSINLYISDKVSKRVHDKNKYYNAIQKLTKYEEAEEQGLLSYKSCSEEELSSKTTCLTCKNNQEFPPPHTCDICNSLDEEFGCMYERRENDGE